MKVGEQAQGTDLVQVLIGEQGKFLATAPDGGTFVAECRSGNSLTSLQYLGPQGSVETTLTPLNGLWNIRKIAQTQSSDQSPQAPQASQFGRQQGQGQQQQPTYQQQPVYSGQISGGQPPQGH